MANKPNYKASEINGPSIYHLKNQTVHYDMFTKNGYVLTSSDLNAYSLYSNKWLFGLIALLLTFLIWDRIFLSILLCLLIVGAFEAWYRIKKVPDLYTIPNFQRPYQNNIVISFAKNSSKGMLIAFLVFSLLISTATTYVLLTAPEEANTASMWFMLILTLGCAIVSGGAIAVKAKH